MEEKIMRFKQKYPDRVPIIITRDPRAKCVELNNSKFLVPRSLTIGQFVCLVRKRLKMDESKAIFVFIDNMLPSLSITVETAWDDNRSADDILYMTYSTENTFG